jgi:iron-sulfur cluster repair protein YtfE (RIC family)
METDTTEIRERLKRAADQIQAQHRRFEPLFEELTRSLASGTCREAQTAVFRIDGAIKAHFQLEERIVFPSIRGLYPERQAELEELSKDHREIGAGLQSVIDPILEEKLDLAAQALEKCWRAVKDHEVREEAFLNGLDSAPSDTTL